MHTTGLEGAVEMSSLRNCVDSCELWSRVCLLNWEAQRTTPSAVMVLIHLFLKCMGAVCLPCAKHNTLVAEANAKRTFCPLS